jgi:hypothetical protein
VGSVPGPAASGRGAAVNWEALALIVAVLIIARFLYWLNGGEW